MTEERLGIGHTAAGGEPRIGIFWMIATKTGLQLLTASCAVSKAEPYGDCLTFGPGQYQVWQSWRRTRNLPAAARPIVRTYEYEDWPRGRIVFDCAKDRFMLYADRKLIAAEIINRICDCFHLPKERTSIETDSHYRSTEAI
jgi:hypothetical protein